MVKKFLQASVKDNLPAILLIIAGTAALSLTMARSGFLYPFGIGFWGPNGHDGVWHLALINQVLQGFPPPNPVFAGELLTNYHYFYDLFLGAINKLTGISGSALYFQIFPVITAVLLGVLVYKVSLLWSKDKKTSLWTLFFTYFAGSLGFVVTLLREGKIGGESMFWSMQAASTLINPPFAASLVVLLAGMFVLLNTKKWDFKKIALTAVLFGVLINIKVYAGLVGLVALGVYSLLRLKRKELQPFLVFTFSSLISGVLFLLVNKGASSLIVFEPWWFIHQMFESFDRLYVPNLALLRYSFAASGSTVPLFLIEAFGLLIFLVGNFGTRIIGVFDVVQKTVKGKLSDFDWFLLAGIIAGIVPPLLFIQKGTAWNTIQFFYYSLFFANFFAAATLAKISKAKTVGLVTSGLIVLLTIPTTYSTLKDYLGNPPPSAIPTDEFLGLSLLAKEPEGVVLTYPFERMDNTGRPTPIPLYIYESTAYVSAYSGKPTYLEDEVNLEITGYNWRARRLKIKEEFLEAQEDYISKDFLRREGISYIYLVPGQELPYTERQLEVESIFDQAEVRIYRAL